MKWTVKDYEQWQQAKEYVDTVILPLMSIRWNQKETIASNEYISLVSTELEQVLKGRVLLSLPFTYGFESRESTLERLQEVCEELKRDFTYVFCITGDERWKDVGDIKWIHTMPIHQLSKEAVQELVKIESTKLYENIVEKWN